MAQHSTRARARRSAALHMGVVDQVILAFNPRNRLAAALGFLAGGVVPAATYVEAHYDMDPARPLYEQVTTFMVLGGLLFSAKTVFAWAKRAFHDGWKAAGFVLLLEGVMITSHVPILPLVLLAILVAINGVATGCVLSLERADEQPVSAPASAWDPVVAPAPLPKRAAASRGLRVTSKVEETQDVGTHELALTRARMKRSANSTPAQKHFAFLKVPSDLS